MHLPANSANYLQSYILPTLFPALLMPSFALSPLSNALSPPTPARQQLILSYYILPLKSIAFHPKIAFLTGRHIFHHCFSYLHCGPAFLPAFPCNAPFLRSHASRLHPLSSFLLPVSVFPLPADSFPFSLPLPFPYALPTLPLPFYLLRFPSSSSH